MDQKMNVIRRLVATALVTMAGSAAASGDSGTSAMGEMQLSGVHLGMMALGLVGLGGVVWVVSKVMSR